MMALASRLAFAGHVALSIGSAVAFTTFLAGAPPAWLLEPDAQRALRLGWTYSGPLCVLLGAAAALLHSVRRFGAARSLGLFASASAIALASELLGTHTGYPFGGYSYTPLLGYRILGLVPFVIPISWFYMLYASLAICARLARGGLLPVQSAGRAGLWGWSLAAGLILTAWDVSMDPAMVATAHWVWHAPGPFYGMPWSNWAGWLLTGTVIARVMLAIVPPQRIVERLATSRLPLAIYAVNGVLPIAICIRDGMWWAAGLGAVAMLLPLALALRLRPSTSAERAPDNSMAMRSA